MLNLAETNNPGFNHRIAGFMKILIIIEKMSFIHEKYKNVIVPLKVSAALYRLLPTWNKAPITQTPNFIFMSREYSKDHVIFTLFTVTTKVPVSANL